MTENISEMSVDEVDLALLDALLRDASQRLEDLATLVGLVPSSVHDRLRRLERDGIIQRWTIDLDSAAVGLGVLAFVGVRASMPCSKLIPALEAIPAIEECHSVAGELSVLLKVRVADTPALFDLLERLRQVPGIVQTESTIVMRTQIDRPTPILTPRGRKGKPERRAATS